MGNLVFPALVVLMALSRSFALTSVLLLGVGFLYYLYRHITHGLRSSDGGSAVEAD